MQRPQSSSPARATMPRTPRSPVKGIKEPLQIRIPQDVKRRFKAHAAMRGIRPPRIVRRSVGPLREDAHMTGGRFKHEAARNGRTTDVNPADELMRFAGSNRFSTILADPPWRFVNRTGKMAPEHRRLARYDTMTVEEIAALPVAKILKPTAHLYLWVPNALLPDGIKVMAAWGFEYKSNIVWHKLRKDGGSDGRGVGFHSGTSRRCCCSACAARMRGRSRLAGAKSTTSGRASANTLGSLTSNTSSSRIVAPALISNYLPAALGPNGRSGATRRMMLTSPLGILTPIIRPQNGG